VASSGGNDPRASKAAQNEQRTADMYTQLARYAARIMVVHEAGRILRSTTDPRELAGGLLKAIAEPLFANCGCVARLEKDELSMLATVGLDEAEADALVASANEAAVWFNVVDAGEARSRKQLMESVRWPKSEETDAPAAPPEPFFELYVPLQAERQVLGVLALGPRVDAQPHRPEDLKFTVALASHLALALDHAGLLEDQARRIEQLSVLLRISREITSTLDLDGVLTTIAHMTAMVVPNRRTTVALVTGQKVEIRASSEPGFDLKAARSDPLLPALRWALGARQPVNVSAGLMEVNKEIPGRDVMLPLLQVENGPRGLAILPLEDDQGVIGMLAIESKANELVTILANQTTVAMRNAELYQRVPMIGALDSLLGRSRTGGVNRRRWVLLGAAAIIAAVGFLIPLPAWVSGEAGVRPAVPIAVRAETAGIVEEVRVIEGQEIAAGELLARLRRDELDVAREQVRAGIQRTRAEAAGARDRADLATYSSLQAEMSKLRDELRFLETELQRTDLVAPVSGVVLTPWVELRKGERLARGDTLLELADLTSMEVEVLVPEVDIGDIEPGAEARLKVHAYPRRTFYGEVMKIAPRAGEERSFRVLVRMDNADGALRPGMTGRAHVDIAPRPFLRWFLRPFVRWFRFKFWL